MGGLFTGIALDRAGHDVTVYEQSTGELSSRGGGIVAQREIREFLSRHDIVAPDEIMTTSTERRFLTADGGVQDAKPESMQFTSWDALYRQLREAFPDDSYRMGRTVTDVTPPTATAKFADGTETTADLLVAAEGGESTTRQQLFPDVSPGFADYVAWRGVVSEADLSPEVRGTFDGRFTFYQGPSMLILAYFIPGPDGETAPGERRLNWVWYDTLSGRDRETIFTDATERQQRFSVPPGLLREPVETRQRQRADSTLPPVFADLVAATTDPFVQAIYDLTVSEMTVDRICLLGDAAFGARPHTAAGTSKAAGDGVALATELMNANSLGTALSAWDDTRSQYGKRLVAQGKQMGDERLRLG